MGSTKFIGFLILMCCPFLGFSDSDFQKWSGFEAGSTSSYNAHTKIQAATSKEIDDSVKASMQKKLDELTANQKPNKSTSLIGLPGFVFVQQVGQ